MSSCVAEHAERLHLAPLRLRLPSPGKPLPFAPPSPSRCRPAAGPALGSTARALPPLRSPAAEVIACVSVNDPFVMGAWGEAHQAGGKVAMLADTRVRREGQARPPAEGAHWPGEPFHATGRGPGQGAQRQARRCAHLWF